MIIFQSENVFATRYNKKVSHVNHFIWLLLFTCLLMTGCATDHGSMLPVQDARSSIEERWGVKPLSIRLSAEGYMLDFRYRVLDPEKAMPLFDRKIKPYLVDEATGAMFAVPAPPKVERCGPRGSLFRTATTSSCLQTRGNLLNGVTR